MIYQTEQELNTAIKAGKLQRVYLLYGRDAFLKEHYAQSIIKKAVDPAFASFNLNRFDGKKLDYNQLYDAVLSPPLMGGSRCVLVDDPEIEKLTQGDYKKLQQILQETEDGTIVILLIRSPVFDLKKSAKCKGLAELCGKLGGVICLNERTQNDLVRTIRSRCEKAGCEIDPADAAYLVERCSKELVALLGEVDKLTAYCKGRTITREDIGKVTAPTVEAEVYDLSKLILRGDYSGAMTILAKLLYLREPEINILYALSGAFTDLYRAKVARHSGVSQEEVVKALGYPKVLEFRVRNAMRDCQKYSLRFLKRSLEVLAEADYQLKSARTDNRIILEQAITELFVALQKEGKH